MRFIPSPTSAAPELFESGHEPFYAVALLVEFRSKRLLRAEFAGTRNGATPHKKRAGRLVPALGVSF